VYVDTSAWSIKGSSKIGKKRRGWKKSGDTDRKGVKDGNSGEKAQRKETGVHTGAHGVIRQDMCEAISV